MSPIHEQMGQVYVTVGSTPLSPNLTSMEPPDRRNELVRELLDVTAA